MVEEMGAELAESEGEGVGRKANGRQKKAKRWWGRQIGRREALKDEEEGARWTGGEREGKLTAACHKETVPNWPISRPQIEPAVLFFSFFFFFFLTSLTL